MLLGQDLQATASSPRKGRRGPLDYIIPKMKRPPLAGWLRHAVRSAWFWITILVVLMVTAVIVISIMYWDWLSIESNGSTIRNIVLVAAAMIALPLAIWRSTVAERQADTAQRGLLNERYQKGAEMLGSRVPSVRLGGIYALTRLAREYSGDYHTQIMRLFCAFVRNPTAELNRDGSEEGNARPVRLREDVRAVMTAVGTRNGSQIETEKKEKYRLDLFNADLKGLCLYRADLRRVDMGGADLSGARLMEDTNLSETFLLGVNLSEAFLDGTDLRNCQGLIQKELDHAIAKPDNPPHLEGALDAKTGEPLLWRSRR